MPSRAEVTAYRDAQNLLVERARRDLQRFWSRLDTANIVPTREALEDFFPILVQRYGNGAATLAAEWFEQQIGQAAVLAPEINAAAANASMRWSLGGILRGDAGQAFAALGGVLDRLVKQQGRETISRSARHARVGWARVPTGAHTCAFCLMLASRGAAYGSQQSATIRADGDSYHGDCDCVATPVRDDSDLPAGYDPEELSGVYLKARAEAGSGDVSAILAAMRQQQGIS